MSGPGTGVLKAALTRTLPARYLDGMTNPPKVTDEQARELIRKWTPETMEKFAEWLADVRYDIESFPPGI